MEAGSIILILGGLLGLAGLMIAHILERNRGAGLTIGFVLGVAIGYCTVVF